MKTTVLLSILFASTLSFAKDVQNSTINVAPSNIAQVFTLVDKSTDGVNKKLNIVVEDTGKSTDMSARYKVYLGYASRAEMGTLSADFEITDQAFSVESARRIEGGVYEVVTTELRENSSSEDEYSEAFFNVTYHIDARGLFSAEAKMIKECEDYCHGVISSSIIVTDSAVIQ